MGEGSRISRAQPGATLPAPLGGSAESREDFPLGKGVLRLALERSFEMQGQNRQRGAN